MPEHSFNQDNTESQILQSSAQKMYRENDESKSHPVSQSSPFAELVRNILAGLTESVSRIFDRDRWLLFKYIIEMKIVYSMLFSESNWEADDVYFLLGLSTVLLLLLLLGLFVCLHCKRKLIRR